MHKMLRVKFRDTNTWISAADLCTQDFLTASWNKSKRKKEKIYFSIVYENVSIKSPYLTRGFTAVKYIAENGQN